MTRPGFSAYKSILLDYNGYKGAWKLVAHTQSRKATDSILGFDQGEKKKELKQEASTSLKIAILLAFGLTVAVFPNQEWQCNI